MALEWCQPCKERGRLSMARHDVALTLMCDECFGGRPTKGVSAALLRTMAPAKEKEKPMGKVTDEATKEAIRKDVAAGLTINQAAEKHGVGWITAKVIVDGANGNGKKAAGGGRPKRTAAATNGRAGKTSGVTLNATAELCDGIWNALPLERKAALLNRLSEV